MRIEDIEKFEVENLELDVKLNCDVRFWRRSDSVVSALSNQFCFAQPNKFEYDNFRQETWTCEAVTHALRV